jgi:hypothetical protein
VNLKFQMEQVLEAIISGGGDHQDVENAILHIILNRGIGNTPIYVLISTKLVMRKRKGILHLKNKIFQYWPDC